MVGGLREQVGVLWRRAADEPSYTGLAASAAVHVVLLIVLAWLWLGRDPGEAGLAALDSRWEAAEPAETLTELELATDDPTPDDTDGGRAPDVLTPASDAVELPALFPTFAAPAPAEDQSAEQLLAAGLADEVGAAPATVDDGSGGSGDGEGAGDGDGRGFFGAKPNGRRFVYVVDRSGSMNYPHDSEAKTRFRRLKMELLSSIGQMTPDMEFYIIFFNEDPHPMPARELQSATPEAKQHFLEWMSRVRAVGRTDPRIALKIAMRLEPDTIYFLSDGSFQHQITQDLRQIRQRQAVIHTFAFGETAGRETLEWIAANNRGKYHFVP